MGRMQRRSLGSTASLTPKGRGDQSMPIQPGTEEDADHGARQAPRDMATAGGLAVQCPSVHGGPLATASHRQGDASHRQADGLGDLCESSPAQCGRGRHAWTASVTRPRVVGVHGGMAYGVRARGARSCRRSRRTGQPSPGALPGLGAGQQAALHGGGTGRREASRLALPQHGNWRAG